MVPKTISLNQRLEVRGEVYIGKKDFADIKTEVTFIGLGHFFQIVNPDTAFDLQNKSRVRLNLNKKTLGKILRGSDE